MAASQSITTFHQILLFASSRSVNSHCMTIMFVLTKRARHPSDMYKAFCNGLVVAKLSKRNFNSMVMKRVSLQWCTANTLETIDQLKGGIDSDNLTLYEMALLGWFLKRFVMRRQTILKVRKKAYWHWCSQVRY